MRMTKIRSFSITKFGEVINEDAVLVRDGLIAISDGAGGGGVFADEWSRYLLSKLPEKPFENYVEFDNWVNCIAGDFYDSHEVIAKQKGGPFLEKFYDEGAFATLIAVWKISSNDYVWVSYGDSVAFAYNPIDNKLEHSFSRLADFNQPPHLISLISPLDSKSFRRGHFVVPQGAYVFVTSDALAHYIIARYNSETGQVEEINSAVMAKSRNASYVKAIQAIKDNGFYEDVVLKFSKNAHHKVNSERILRKLISNGLLGLDDYSIAFMPKTGCDT